MRRGYVSLNHNPAFKQRYIMFNGVNLGDSDRIRSFLFLPL